MSEISKIVSCHQKKHFMCGAVVKHQSMVVGSTNIFKCNNESLVTYCMLQRGQVKYVYMETHSHTE